MRIAFSTLGCPDWTWQDVLTQGPRMGYDGVEVRLICRDTELLERPEFQPGELPTRRKELRDAGFCVCGLASSVRFDYPGVAERQQQFAVGRAYLDLAAELGALFVRVFGDVVPDEKDRPARETAISQIAEGLERLGEYAAGLRLEVLIETHGDFSDSRLVAETLQQVGCPAAGVLWDTHHPWRFCGEELSETAGRIGRWVGHTHWKDSIVRPERRDDAEAHQAAQAAHRLMSGHRHADYVLFGGGEFPALECARLLRRMGYDGWCCLEWEKMWHPELEPPETALPRFPPKMRQLWEAAGPANGD